MQNLPQKVFICDFSDLKEHLKDHKVDSRDSIPRIEGFVKVPDSIPKSASQGPILPKEEPEAKVMSKADKPKWTGGLGKVRAV